ncbi:MAG: hypothetical protein D6762_01025 [Candidatus Neomarinimicrobiota bacterium]|nr:MAG: hypothetical protein D6762_01025 [Candidatus Neomarinimicrobiota bacterium]
MKHPQPRIEKDRWGRIVLSSGEVFKDVKLWPGGAIEWDWRKTGTSHESGIQWADVEPCLQSEARLVLLSRGRMNRLQVPASLVERLRASGYEVQVEDTARIISRYNACIDQGQPVIALIHSTC